MSIVLPAKLNSSTISSHPLPPLLLPNVPKHPCVSDSHHTDPTPVPGSGACPCSLSARELHGEQERMMHLHGAVRRTHLCQVHLCISRAENGHLKAGTVCPLVSAPRASPGYWCWFGKHEVQPPDCSAGLDAGLGHLGAYFYLPLLWHHPACPTSTDLCLQLLESRRWGSLCLWAHGPYGPATFSVLPTARSPRVLAEPLLFIDPHALASVKQARPARRAHRPLGSG